MARPVRPAISGARLLDVTRLMRAYGFGPFTGIERVDLAYLDRFIADGSGPKTARPVFGLVNTRLGHLVLDIDGLRALRGQLDQPGGRAEMLARLRDVAIMRASRLGLWRLISTLKRRNQGLSYVNCSHSTVRWRVAIVLRLLRVHQTYLVHDFFPLDYPDQHLRGSVTQFGLRMRVISRFADLVIYNSTDSQNKARRHFARFGRVPPGITAHLGSDLPKIAPGPLPAGLGARPFVLCVGTLQPRKNHEFLLDLWDALRRDNHAKTDPNSGKSGIPQLVIAGRRGWLNHALFARLDALTGDDVIELNDCDDATLAGLMAAACGMALPSLVEGFGLPALEAAQAGLPLIVNDLPIYHEFLGDYPVYAPLTDLYLWKQTILEMADCKRFSDKTGGMDPHDVGQTGAVGAFSHKHPRDLPDWDQHFAIVLTRI